MILFDDPPEENQEQEQKENAQNLDDAPEDKNEDDKKSKQKNKFSRKQIIIFSSITGSVILVVLGILGYLFLRSPEEQESIEKQTQKRTIKRPQDIIIYEFPDITVDLNSTGNKRTFLKAGFRFELEKAADEKIIEALTPRIMDSFLSYLRQQKLEDFEKPHYLEKIREDLLLRLNAITHPIKVPFLLYREHIIQ